MPDSSNGTVILISSKVENAFRKVRDIQEFIKRYSSGSDHIPVSIEDTQWAIEEKYGLKINKELIDFDAQHIRGMMERYEDGTANVFIRQFQDKDQKINTFWHRFIAVKEMMHLSIDESEDWSADGSETIEELIKVHGVSIFKVPSSNVQSENLAEIAAFEVLYPMEFRRADLKSRKSFAELSAAYGVPVYVIERVLSADYMKLARTMWSEVDGHGLGGIGSDPTA